MEKKDLKTGMIIETSDGILRVLLGNTLISYENGGMPLKWFSDDLKCLESYSDEDIIKVYSKPLNNELCADLRFWFHEKNIIDYCNLLWKRKEEKIIVELDGVEYSESTLRSIIKKATS